MRFKENKFGSKCNLFTSDLWWKPQLYRLNSHGLGLQLRVSPNTAILCTSVSLSVPIHECHWDTPAIPWLLHTQTHTHTSVFSLGHKRSGKERCMSNSIRNDGGGWGRSYWIRFKQLHAVAFTCVCVWASERAHNYSFCSALLTPLFCNTAGYPCSPLSLIQLSYTALLTHSPGPSPMPACSFQTKQCVFTHVCVWKILNLHLL